MKFPSQTHGPEFYDSDLKMLEMPEPWNICPKELVNRIGYWERRVLQAAELEVLKPSSPLKLVLDIKHGLTQLGDEYPSFSHYVLYSSLLQGNVYSVSLCIGSMWYAFWFYIELLVRDFLESKKRLWILKNCYSWPTQNELGGIFWICCLILLILALYVLLVFWLFGFLFCI